MEFEKKKLEDWVAKVERDLKGKSIDELSHEVAGIRMPLFLHPDHGIEPVQLVEKRHKVLLGEWFSYDDPDVNSKMHTALNGGVNSPGLFVPNEVDDFSDLLKGVNMEMVSFAFDIKDIDLIDRIRKQTTQVENSQNVSIIYRCAHEILISERSIPGLFKRDCILIKIGELRNVEDLAKTAIYISSLLELLCDQDHCSGDIGISLQINQNYLEQIGILRALRILAQNLLVAYRLDDQLRFKIDADICGNENNKVPDQLISSTIKAMAATIGGVNRISVNIVDTSNTYDEMMRRRLGRNIFHLLEMESGMLKVSDPASGSFYFDALSKNLAETAWKIFVEKQGKPES